MAEAIKKIKILDNCRASGKSFEFGKTYSIPKNISVKDAEILIRMRRAENATETKEDAEGEKK